MKNFKRANERIEMIEAQINSNSELLSHAIELRAWSNVVKYANNLDVLDAIRFDIIMNTISSEFSGYTNNRLLG